MNFSKETTKDLQKMLAEKKAGLRSVRFGTSGSKSKNVKEAQNLKKEIAMILTEMRTREISES